MAKDIPIKHFMIKRVLLIIVMIFFSNLFFYLLFIEFFDSKEVLNLYKGMHYPKEPGLIFVLWNVVHDIPQKIERNYSWIDVSLYDRRNRMVLSRCKLLVSNEKSKVKGKKMILGLRARELKLLLKYQGEEVLKAFPFKKKLKVERNRSYSYEIKF